MPLDEDQYSSMDNLEDLKPVGPNKVRLEEKSDPNVIENASPNTNFTFTPQSSEKSCNRLTDKETDCNLYLNILYLYFIQGWSQEKI